MNANNGLLLKFYHLCRSGSRSIAKSFRLIVSGTYGSHKRRYIMYTKISLELRCDGLLIYGKSSRQAELSNFADN